jgi:hypothetical protein
MSSGKIVIEETETNKCVAAESLVFELVNLSRKKDFDDMEAAATNGKISREEYTRKTERYEYENALAVLKTLDSCKGVWGCGGAASSSLAFVKKAKNFDDYYKNFLDKGHIERAASRWDYYQAQPGATKWVPPKKK